MAWPATWPPPALPVNRTNADPQQDTHPNDHNLIGSTINGDIVGALSELHEIIDRFATGQPGLDYVNLKSSLNRIIVSVHNARWLQVQTNPNPGAPMVMMGEAAPTADRYGVISGDGVGADGFPVVIIGTHKITGSGTPKYWLQVGSRTAAEMVRMQFVNITDIEATVAWPVTSTVELKSTVTELGDIPDIRTLHVVRYIRNDDPRAIERIGFIAEELAEVLPEAAVWADDGVSRSYLNEVVTATLVATVQDLLTRIEALEGATP